MSGLSRQVQRAIARRERKVHHYDLGRVQVHEAGHALAAFLLADAFGYEPNHMVTEVEIFPPRPGYTQTGVTTQVGMPKAAAKILADLRGGNSLGLAGEPEYFTYLV